MILNIDKLKALWAKKNDIFSDPANEFIIKRFNSVTELFGKIENYTVTYPANETEKLKIQKGDGPPQDIQLSNNNSPNLSYFGCAKDGFPDNDAFNGIKKQGEAFCDYQDIIIKIGCLLGGYDLVTHRMMPEYRILSNVINDSENINLACGIINQWPSAHLANNNYFFNVIDTITRIKKEDGTENRFTKDDSRLVLRYSNVKGESQQQFQQNALWHRFPYKFFYMWTHRDSVIHPVSLMAYQGLVLQEDADLKFDEDMNMEYNTFINGNDETKKWEEYSCNILRKILEYDDNRSLTEDDIKIHFPDLSKLISIITIQNQSIKNMQELLETGNKAIILYGPPGTGKTYQAKKIVCDEFDITEEEMKNYQFLKETSQTTDITATGETTYHVTEKGAWTIVQFHPNYTYEDFIGGITPKLESGNLNYKLKEGIFKALCDTAAAAAEEEEEAAQVEEAKKKFIIIIDEINRADLSSVFGELMYALEYRDEPISIPNFDNPFTIPSNVYIIGTMNSIDKSLVTFDLALRRRFGFYKLMPNLSALVSILKGYNIVSTELKKFIERCYELNEGIVNSENNFNLGEDYQIGQAYFGKIKDFLKKQSTDGQQGQGTDGQHISSFELEKLWEYHLSPLLEEYLGNRIEDPEIKKNLTTLKDNFIKPL